MCKKFKYFAIMISLILFFTGCDSPGINDVVNEPIDDGKLEASIRIVSWNQDSHYSEQHGQTLYKSYANVDIELVNTGEVDIYLWEAAFDITFSDGSMRKDFWRTGIAPSFRDTLKPAEGLYRTVKVGNFSLSHSYYMAVYVVKIVISQYLLNHHP